MLTLIRECASIIAAGRLSVDTGERLTRQLNELMAKHNNFHVVPRDGGWAVKQENTSFDAGSCRYQSDAAAMARHFVLMRGGGEVVIHRPTGEIREKNTIGKADPFPPRG